MVQLTYLNEGVVVVARINSDAKKMNTGVPVVADSTKNKYGETK
jgi:hypothetical protein